MTPTMLRVADSCMKCGEKKKGFFCNLSPVDMKAFEALRLTSSYPRGVMLFTEGDLARGVMVLCKGHVKLTMTSSTGKVIILRLASPGEVLGLHSVISNAPLQASAETAEPCQVAFLRREDFLRYVGEHPQAALRAAEQLSTGYEAACEQVRALALAPSAHGKLARFLLHLCHKSPASSNDVCAKLTLTHEEIGQMIGVSRETVTRTLGEFKSNHLVVLHGASLQIPNKSALQTMAGG